MEEHGENGGLPAPDEDAVLSTLLLHEALIGTEAVIASLDQIQCGWFRQGTDSRRVVDTLMRIRFDRGFPTTRELFIAELNDALPPGRDARAMYMAAMSIDVGFIDLPERIRRMQHRKTRELKSAIYERLARNPDDVELIFQSNLELKELDRAAAHVELAWTDTIELHENPPPELEWLVHGLIAKGKITLLSATHKRGKSLAALQACINITAGTGKWFGRDVVRKGNAVLLSAEGGMQMIAARMRQLCGGEPPPKITVLAGLTGQGYRMPDLVRAPRVLDDIFTEAQRRDADVIVFDPLSWFFPMEDENAAGPMRQLLLAIHDQAARTNIAVLIVHHDPRPNRDNAGTDTTGGRGSSELANFPDFVITMRAAGTEDPRESKVYFSSRWSQADPGLVRVNPDTLWVEWVSTLGDTSGARKATGGGSQQFNMNELLEILPSLGDGMTLKQIAAHLDCSRNTAKSLVLTGKKYGDIKTRVGPRGAMIALRVEQD